MSEDLAMRQAEAARGRAAADLLANPLLQEALDKVEQGYVRAWADNVAADGSALRLGPEGRERLWHAVQVVRKVRENLAAVIATGEMARRQLEDTAAAKRPWYAR